MVQRRARLLFAGWVGWACVVLGFYYVVLLRSIADRRLPSDLDAPGAGLALLIVAASVGLARRAGRPRFLMMWRVIQPGLPFRGRGATAALGLAGLAAVPWTLTWPGLTARMARFGVPHFPFAGEAAARAVVALVGASLVAAAAIGAGTLMLRTLRWRAATRGEHLLFAAVTGVLVVSYGSLLLAVLGIYRPWAVALLIAVLCLGGSYGARPAEGGADRVPDHPDARNAPWLALTVVALGYGFITALAPEKEFDALWYHLNLPRLWLEAGRPVDLIEEYVSLYPLTWELVFGDGMVLGGVAGAKLLHFACLPLLGAVVWQAARRYLPGAAAAAAVALVVTTPTMLWQGGTAYVDLALALHGAAACYALARYSENGEFAWGAVAAIQFGAAAATKHLGVIVTLVALGIYVVAAIGDKCGAKVALRRALLLGAAAAVIPAAWYVRSWAASGNPVFPEMFSVFGAYPPQRWDVISERALAHFKAHFGFGHSIRDLLALPWNITVHGARFKGSLGPIFLVLLPGLLFLRRSRAAAAWLCAGITAYLAFWASPISSYQMRFLMPIVPGLALVAAASLEGLADAAALAFSRGRGLLTAAILLLAAINLPPFTRLHEADRSGWNGWLTHVVRSTPLSVVIGRESESAYLRREVPSFAAWQAVEALVPVDGRVFTFTGGDRLFARRRYVPHDSTLARAALDATAGDSVRAAAALRSMGITHVLFDRQMLASLSADSLAIGSAAFEHGCIREYADRRFWLCRVDYARLLPAVVSGGRSAARESSVARARPLLPDDGAAASRDRRTCRTIRPAL